MGTPDLRGEAEGAPEEPPPGTPSAELAEVQEDDLPEVTAEPQARQRGVHIIPPPVKGELLGAVVEQSYAGPLPRASEFARYGEVLDSAPERILAMAESAQAHEQAVQAKALEADIADRQRDRVETRIGQILGAILVALALALGAICGGWFGGVITAVGGAGFAGAFVYHIRSRKSATPPQEEPEDPS